LDFWLFQKQKHLKNQTKHPLVSCESRWRILPFLNYRNLVFAIACINFVSLQKTYHLSWIGIGRGIRIHENTWFITVNWHKRWLVQGKCLLCCAGNLKWSYMLKPWLAVGPAAGSVATATKIYGHLGASPAGLARQRSMSPWMDQRFRPEHWIAGHAVQASSALVALPAWCVSLSLSLSLSLSQRTAPAYWANFVSKPRVLCSLSIPFEYSHCSRKKKRIQSLLVVTTLSNNFEL
jgi:hypothetical protein